MLCPRLCSGLTTKSAASFIVAPTWKFSPDSFRIWRPSSTLVPSSRSTMGTFTFKLRAAATTPVARRSTRRMPPKMLMKMAFTLRVGEQDLKGVLDLLLGCAAAHIQEIGGAAAGVLNDVHGGHGQARAVDHAGDGAVELDVVERVFAGLDFKRVFFGGVAQRLDVGDGGRARCRRR